MENQGVCSIIVPVYNVEKQLMRCIDSLTAQSYPYLEILLVDDGSKDSSGAICDRAAEADSRIRVIHQQNAGLGMARNAGLDQATGDYVLFVDSDDYVAPNYAETLLRALLDYRADLVLMGHIRELSGGKQVIKSIVSCAQYVDAFQMIDRVLLPIIGAEPAHAGDVELDMSVWMCIYKRSILAENGLRFLSEREVVSEDLFFNMEYILRAQSAVLIPECLYYYVDNSSSLTNTYRADRFEKYCVMLRYQEQFLQAHHLFERARIRQCRTFLMKTKKCIASIATGKLSLREKRIACKNILHSPVLIQILEQYGQYACLRHQKLQLFMLKHKLVNSLLLLYQVKAWKARK